MPFNDSSEQFPRMFNSDYELLSLIGKGGMSGAVYKARQIKLERVVALKVLDITGDPEAEQRFKREAQSMKELHHHNLATVFDYGVQNNQIFIAMNFVDGEPLSDILKDKKRLSVKETLYVIYQIAKGLQYAHSHGVIHRDIKPSNIIVKSNYDICIIDFGISLKHSDSRLTNPGMTMGTPEYMSPEQCQNKNITLQSDIYSLGIMAYEMLAGELPFTGNTPLAILRKHLDETPPPLTQKNPDVPAEFELVIKKCLAKKTDDRYQNMDILLEDLKGISEGNVLKLRNTKTISVNLETKTNKVVFSTLCLVPVLLILVILLISLKSSPNSIELLHGKSLELTTVGYQTDNLEKDHPEGYPPIALFDDNLSTAWLVPVEKAKGNKNFLTVKFKKTTIITNLGIAVGYQKEQNDFLKDRFTVFNKPKEIWVYSANANVSGQSEPQKIILADKRGVQYPTWIPIEATELLFELKSLQNETNTKELAISEIRILGIETDGN